MRIGMSSGVLLMIIFWVRTIFELHRKAIRIAIPKTNHILLNSKIS